MDEVIVIVDGREEGDEEVMREENVRGVDDDKEDVSDGVDDLAPVRIFVISIHLRDYHESGMHDTKFSIYTYLRICDCSCDNAVTRDGAAAALYVEGTAALQHRRASIVVIRRSLGG